MFIKKGLIHAGSKAISMASTNNSVYDTSMVSPAFPDIREETSGGQSFFVNSSFNLSDISFSPASTGRIYVQHRTGRFC